MSRAVSDAAQIERLIELASAALAAPPPTTIPRAWQPWLETLFPQYITAPFSERHADLWVWIWAIRLGIRPPPFVAA